MARANLIITDALKEAFRAGLEGVDTRWIKAKLDNESITLENVGQVSEDIEQDLGHLRYGMNEDSPCFVLVCLNPNASVKEWVLLTFLPDSSKVRDKMLYASGSQDIRTRLGSSHFVGDMRITSLDELTRESISNVTRIQTNNLPFTEQEILMKEEIAASASRATSSQAIGLVPFKIENKVEHALAEFNRESLNIVELFVSKQEAVELGSISSVNADDLSSSTINASEPRFYLLRRKCYKDERKVFFLFSCPDGCNVRQRMIHATSKSSVIRRINSSSIVIDKILELTDPEEVDKLLLEQVAPESNASVELAQKTFSKPSRPGRGKARIIKPRA